MELKNEDQSSVKVEAYPFVVSKHQFPGNYLGEGSESGEGEAGEGSSEGGSNG
jgi:hypothetical protein